MMKSGFRTIMLALLASLICYGQETTPPPSRVQKKPPATAPSSQTPSEPPPQAQAPPSQRRSEATPSERPGQQQRAEAAAGEEMAPTQPMHFDMAEVPPVQTHHEIHIDGKLLHYTATAGRMPIKNGEGKIEAEMFFVAYTLDG